MDMTRQGRSIICRLMWGSAVVLLALTGCGDTEDGRNQANEQVLQEQSVIAKDSRTETFAEAGSDGANVDIADADSTNANRKNAKRTNAENSDMNRVNDDSGKTEDSAERIGIEEIKELLVDTEAASKELCKGAKMLQDGSWKLAGGAEEINSGATRLKEGTEELEEGAEALAAGTETLRTGTAALSDGADKLHSGMAALYQGVGELDTGISGVRAGVQELSGQSRNIAAGVKELEDEMSSLLAGNILLMEGSGQLAAGSLPLTKGAEELSRGIDLAAGAATALAAAFAGDGTDANPGLASGSRELTQNMVQLNTLINTYFQTYESDISQTIELLENKRNMAIDKEQETKEKLEEAVIVQQQAEDKLLKACASSVGSGEGDTVSGNTLPADQTASYQGSVPAENVLAENISAEMVLEAVTAYKEAGDRVMACKEEALSAKARVEAMEQVIGELTATCQSDGLSEFEAEKAAYIANIKKISAGLQTGAEAVNTGIEKAYVGLTALADSEKGMSALRKGGGKTYGSERQ